MRNLKVYQGGKPIEADAITTAMLFSHSYLTSVFLPYKSLPVETRSITRSSGDITLRLKAGELPSARDPRELVPQPLPTGAKARLILLHLSSRAVKLRSPRVELEASMTAFADELGMATCSKSMKRLQAQVRAMSCVDLEIRRDNGERLEMFRGPLFSRFEASYPKDRRQTLLFPDYVQFSTEYYQSLITKAVPISREMLVEVQTSARAIDLLLWASRRLPQVLPGRTVKIKWTSLRWAFGDRTNNIDTFKRQFKTALRKLKVVYPAANIELVRGGVVIRNSPPAVAFKYKRKEGLIV